MSRFSRSDIVAVLGPTNTGKTHLAIERLCAHSSGIIGFPLRLLAREVYDRVVAIKGADRVALITGEERIAPRGAQWVLATAEAMPMGGDPAKESDLDLGERDYAFVGIDEAQLGTDPERGHVFTNRLLHARGRNETMILGSESLAPMVRALVPEADIQTRPRFSTLSYGGGKKLSRLPPRSAIVAFSTEQVYAVAEMLRRYRGGAAIVMGALSPATRNAQVAMFQSGQVDYLVATDAIGMGLNLDLNHIAFAGLTKFDGTRRRRLMVSEMAQIAGRAGRHQRDGTFGEILGGEHHCEFTPEEVEAIEEHRFAPIERLYWRRPDPRMDSLDTLITDLEERPNQPVLAAAPEAIDLTVLKLLASDPVMAAQVTNPALVQRFWALCSLPDFRQLGAEQHARFVAALWRHLGHGNGHIPRSVAAQRIDELDRNTGDVAQISGRLAGIRTWSYIAQRRDWLADPLEMAERARAIEQRLSDALHSALMQRFVDRRTSALLRTMGQDSGLLPVAIDGDDGAVLVDGEAIGHLAGFRFSVAADARRSERKILLAAAERFLGGELRRRARRLCEADDAAFTLAEAQPFGVQIVWQGHAVARLAAGSSLIRPTVVPGGYLDGLQQADRNAVLARLAAWLEAHIARWLTPLVRLSALTEDKNCPPPLRALAARIGDRGGVIPRRSCTSDIAALDPAARTRLRKLGIKLGSFDLFAPQLFRAAPQALLAQLRLVQTAAATPTAKADIWSLKPVLPGRADDPAPVRTHRRFAGQWLRIDLAEKLATAAHDTRGKATVFAPDTALPTSMGLDMASFERLLREAGFRKAPPVTAHAPATGDASADEEPATPQAPLWRWRGLDKPRRPTDAKNAARKGRGKKAADSAEARKRIVRPGNLFAKLAELDFSK